MQEKTLLILSLVGSLLGIFILFFISNNLELDKSSIDKITFSDVDKNVKVMGNVEEIFENEKVMILEINQLQKMKVVIFKDNNESIDIKKNDYIEVIGKVEEYENELEIIGKRVRIVG